MQLHQQLGIDRLLNVKGAFLFFDWPQRKNHFSKMTWPIRWKFYTNKDGSHFYNTVKFEIDCTQHSQDIQV